MVIKDGEWTLLSRDHKMGRTVWHRFDGQHNHWRTDYDVEPVLKANHDERADNAGGRWKEGRRVASVPLNVYYDKLASAVDQADDKFLSRWLNDGDNRAWRTFEGQV